MHMTPSFFSKVMKERVKIISDLYSAKINNTMEKLWTKMYYEICTAVYKFLLVTIKFIDSDLCHCLVFMSFWNT